MPMKCRLARYLPVLGSIVFLAGCNAAGTPPAPGGGSQLNEFMEGANAVAPGLAGPRSPAARSWMKRVPTGTLLLYASDENYLDAFTYPRGQWVGRASGFSFLQGMCSDNEGNVYVADEFAATAYEIQHGTTTVINFVEGRRFAERMLSFSKWRPCRHRWVGLLQ